MRGAHGELPFYCANLRSESCATRRLDTREKSVRRHSPRSKCRLVFACDVGPPTDNISDGVPYLAVDVAVLFPMFVIGDFVAKTVDLSLQFHAQVDHAEDSRADHSSARQCVMKSYNTRLVCLVDRCVIQVECLWMCKPRASDYLHSCRKRELSQCTTQNRDDFEPVGPAIAGAKEQSFSAHTGGGSQRGYYTGACAGQTLSLRIDDDGLATAVPKNRQAMIAFDERIGGRRVCRCNPYRQRHRPVQAISIGAAACFSSRRRPGWCTSSWNNCLRPPEVIRPIGRIFDQITRFSSSSFSWLDQPVQEKIEGYINTETKFRRRKSSV